MGADDLNPSRSRLLTRRPPQELQGLQDAAVAMLQRLHACGKLKPIGVWHNENGDVVESWPADGDVLECYLDMLGLNERTIVEYATKNATQRRISRKKAHAARG